MDFGQSRPSCYFVFLLPDLACGHACKKGWILRIREMNETKTGHLLASNFPGLHHLNFVLSYRKTFVYVHTTRGVTTVHHKARVAGATEKNNNNKMNQ